MKFHTLTHKGKPVGTILGGGAAGPGKTFVLERDPLFQMVREHERTKLPRNHPHWIPMGGSKGRALLLRRTMPMIQNIMNECHALFKAWDPGVRWKESENLAIFSCGYIYEFGHCKDDKHWERYQGVSKTWIGYDELVQFNEEPFDNINTWLRSGDPVLMNDLRIRMASNPVFTKDKGDDFQVNDPQWVRKRFVDPHPEGNMVIELESDRLDEDGKPYVQTFAYLPATLKDNPDPNFRRTYMSRLAFRPVHIQRALIEADWYVTPGGFFEKTWKPDIHIIDDFDVPLEWKRFRALDWGYKTTGVVLWFCFDPDDNLIIYREYTFQGRTVDKVAERIKEIEVDEKLWHKGRSLITGPADTQIWEQRGGNAPTMAQQFRKAGVRWRFADKSSRAGNAQLVVERLLDWDDRHQHPGLMVMRGCTQTILRFPNVQADPKNPNEPLKGGDDHHYDAVSYGVAFGAKGSKAIPYHMAARRMMDRVGESDGDGGRDGYGGH